MALKQILAAVPLLTQAVLGQGLNLGGTQVPKDKIIVYFMIGHSNMHGEGPLISDGVAHPRAWNYQWFGSKQWIPAREPPGPDETQGLSGHGKGGPGMPFLKGMATAYPNHYFGVISNAQPSCTLRGVNSGHNGSGIPADSNRYWKGATNYNQVVQAAREVQANVTFGGLVVMLGVVEATRTTEEVCRAFSDDAAQMIKDLRADLGLPNLPLIFGEYENGASGTFSLTRPWPKIVDEQIKLIPSKTTVAATVNSVGIKMLDDHHYSTDVGQPEFARRVVEIIRSKGWLPGASAIFSDQKRLTVMGKGARIRLSPAGGVEILGGASAGYLADGKRLSWTDPIESVRP